MLGRTLGTFGLVLLFISAIILVALSFTLGLKHPAPWILLSILLAIPLVHNLYISSRFIRWKKKYSVGIPSIDDDHKKLINLINQLQNANYYFVDKDHERQALNELIDYTKYHFDREEKLMQKFAYPEYEAHQDQHKKMIAKVNAIVEDYEVNADHAINDTVKFLRNWLINHIRKTDMAYKEFFSDKNVI